MPSHTTHEQQLAIQEILEQLDQSDNTTHSGRKSQRKPVRMTLPAILLSSHAHPTFTVHTRNISTSGIAFISKRMFNRGEIAAVVMTLPNKAERLFHCRVAFSRYVRNGFHEVGCEFLECVTNHPGPDRVPAHWIPNMMAVETPKAKASA